MNGLRICGISQVSACGAGMDALRRAFDHEPPQASWVSIRADQSPPQVPVLKAVPEDIDELVPPRSVRRLDDFAKNFIYASSLALHDLPGDRPAPERIGVVTGTSTGSLVTSFSLLDDIILVADDAVSPFKFTTSVNNATATSVATFLGVRGPCLAVLGFKDLLLNVLRIARVWLEEKRVDLVLAAVGDEFHPVIGYGLHHLGGWSGDGKLRPLDFDRCSFVPGETFVALALKRPESGSGPRLESVEALTDSARYRARPDRRVLIAADGRQTSAAHYCKLRDRIEDVGAYASLWGSNFAAEAMQLPAAMVMLEDGVFSPTPGPVRQRQPLPVASSGTMTIDCVALNPDGTGSVVTLSR